MNACVMFILILKLTYYIKHKEILQYYHLQVLSQIHQKRTLEVLILSAFYMFPNCEQSSYTKNIFELALIKNMKCKLKTLCIYCFTQLINTVTNYSY